jgi:ubiquinone/menaquinone biosynthesis C-methylase UbiE
VPIGSVLRHVSGQPRPRLVAWLRNLYYLFYGVPDLHTHIRWRTVRRLVNNNDERDRISVLDVGCGAGHFSFELASKHKGWRVTGIDMNEEGIATATTLKQKLGFSNLEFRTLIATDMSVFPDNHFDLVLLIDVIEHVVEDGALVNGVRRILRPTGSVIISVPTPNYPKVFGRDFHNGIGHVREGYWLEDIVRLLGKDRFKIEDYAYYTYPPSALVCAIVYRHLWDKRVRGLLSPLLNVFSYLDAVWPLRRPEFASSLALRARNKELNT